MPSETKTRVRPQTTASRLNKVRIASNLAVHSRRAKSARARIKVSEDPPPDLIPPEWSPLLCEMTEDVINKRPDSGYETQDGGARSTGSDDEADDFSSRQSTPGPLSGRMVDRINDVFKTENPDLPPLRYTEANPPKPLKRPQTNAQLKDFLAAAMDSVRFFLMTSSVGQAHKEGDEGAQDSEESDSESEKDTEPPQYNRSKLLIMNGALMEPPWRFSIETYKDDPKMLEFYTGFRSYDLIKSIFNLLKPCADTLPVWAASDSPENVREGAFKTGIITLMDEFFLFLYMLRHNPSADDLSVRFSMPRGTVQLILDDWLHYLYGSFGQKAVWPSRDNVDVYMQQCYKSVCPCARIIVHVAKVKVRLPRDLPTKESSAEIDPETEDAVNEPADIPEDIPEEITTDTTEASPKPDAPLAGPLGKPRPSLKVTAVNKLAAIRSMKQPRRMSLRKSEKKEQKPQKEQQQQEQEKQETEGKRSRKDTKKVKQVRDDGIQPDSNDVKHYKSVVIFQPTGAACMVSRLYPTSTPSEDILSQMGVLDMLDECDDVVTVDIEDDLRHDVMEELLHPYAANYMNVNFLTGCLPWDEFKRKSPMKAHRVKCMHWHIYHSISWVRNMKVWDELAELPPSWVEHVERLWTICCLLTNFMPSDPCLDITEEFPEL